MVSNQESNSLSPIEPLSPIITTTTEQAYHPLLNNEEPTTINKPTKKVTTTNTKNNQHQSTTHWKSDTKNFRIQGWDPILILSQILAIQAIHYLILCLIIPPLLYFVANPIPLMYEGGPRNVAMVIDWRAMVGRSTLHLHNNDLSYSINHPISGLNGFGKLPKSLGRKPFRNGKRPPIVDRDSRNSFNNSSTENLGPYPSQDSLNETSLNFGKDWVHRNLQDSNLNSILLYDPNRSWAISIAWFISSLIGVIILYQIVRRPKHIMDHSLTTSLNHLILTTYYSSRLPTSLWFYFVLISSAIVQIVLAEQLCVRREFRDGLGVGWKVDHRPDDY